MTVLILVNACDEASVSSASDQPAFFGKPSKRPGPARFLLNQAMRRPMPQCHKRSQTMPPVLTDQALDYLLASAGLDLSDAQKADLKTIHDGLAAMKARVRQPRGRMAELAHTYGFAAEDLA